LISFAADETVILLAEASPRFLGGTVCVWQAWAHGHQKPPDTGNNGEPWTTWLILGGRGAGKTRAGAEWVRGIATSDPKARIALIGETEHAVREVMVEGVSGLLAVHRTDERPEWIPTRRRLEWKNGAVAQIFSAENYEGLRGPQFSAAWLDELAKWRHADETAAINGWRSPREPLDAFASFAGFES
jgi:phage terminase large subunit-like protein